MGKRNPNRREFLMLAHTYDAKKHSPAGYYVSEKLDGIRAFWDGGITRGLPVAQVPWANTSKHSRFKEELRATGLWSRYGQPIQAPDWWLDSLPNVPLDGELYIGRNLWQETSSIVKTIFGEDKGWQKVKYMAFDCPSLITVLRDGEINNQNYKKTFKNFIPWISERYKLKLVTHQLQDLPNQLPEVNWPFYKVINFFNSTLSELQNDVFKIHTQIKLPATRPQAEFVLKASLEGVERVGGEGLVIRCPMSIWEPLRLNNVLKVKTFKDAEATVVGYVWGEESDNTRTVNGNAESKLLGLMGSLIVEFEGKQFKLSGFSDEERHIYARGVPVAEGALSIGFKYGCEHPGELVALDKFESKRFPIGSQVTFRYRELSDDGIPKEARFWRKAE